MIYLFPSKYNNTGKQNIKFLNNSNKISIEKAQGTNKPVNKNIMSQTKAYQSTLLINQRQRQLQLQNSRLKSELKSSHEIILKLQLEVQKLRSYVGLLKAESIKLGNGKSSSAICQDVHSIRKLTHNQNDQLVITNHPQNIPPSSHSLLLNNKSPIAQKSMIFKQHQSRDFRHQLQVFTSESQSDDDDDRQEYSSQQEAFESIVNQIHPLGKSNKNGYFNDDVNNIEETIGRVNTDERVIYNNNNNGNNNYNHNNNCNNDNDKRQIRLNNSNSKVTPKSLKKIDSTKVFRPLSYFDIDPCDQENSTFSTLQTQLSPQNITRSQRWIPNQQSKIKAQGRIRQVTSPQKVFKKVSMGKPIYDVFFVTGINTKGSPEVIYSYPKQGSQHFQAILAICYSQQALKMKQLTSLGTSPNNNSSKNILCNTNTNILNANSNSHKLKQFYIIPLRKLNADKQNEREYLTICEVEEVILLPKDNVLVPCAFQRMYCFISSQQFFLAYKSLVNQFLDKIHYTRMQTITNTKSITNQQQYKSILKQCLQQPLSILSQKSAQSNHTLSYRLDQFVSISIDIPSIDNSYKLVGQYRPWGVMNFKVQIRPVEQYLNPLEMKLFGLLITYVLSEKKIVLFSASKSKVSEAILHMLEIIRPLQYVCPIIMTVLKQDHQQYFSAPMSLILGLWVEQRKLQRQKIQIFMNRKENLMGQIEKGKTHIENGIVINLDTGLVYGDGLAEGLTATAITINQYYQNYCHHLKDVFKLFSKMFDGKEINRDESELLQIKHKLDSVLKGTQLWTYFVERQHRKDKFHV